MDGPLNVKYKCKHIPYMFLFLFTVYHSLLIFFKLIKKNVQKGNPEKIFHPHVIIKKNNNWYTGRIHN